MKFKETYVILILTASLRTLIWSLETHQQMKYLGTNQVCNLPFLFPHDRIACSLGIDWYNYQPLQSFIASLASLCYWPCQSICCSQKIWSGNSCQVSTKSTELLSWLGRWAAMDRRSVASFLCPLCKMGGIDTLIMAGGMKIVQMRADPCSFFSDCDVWDLCDSCSRKSCGQCEDRFLVPAFAVSWEKEERESVGSTAVWTDVETETDWEDTWSVVHEGSWGWRWDRYQKYLVSLDDGLKMQGTRDITTRCWKSQEQLVDVLFRTSWHLLRERWRQACK